MPYVDWNLWDSILQNGGNVGAVYSGKNANLICVSDLSMRWKALLFTSSLWLYWMALSWTTSFLGKIWEKCPGKNCFLLCKLPFFIFQLLCAWSEPPKIFRFLKLKLPSFGKKKFNQISLFVFLRNKSVWSLNHDGMESLSKAWWSWLPVDIQHGKLNFGY